MGKMESIIKFIRNSEAEAAMFKSEKNRMDERQKNSRKPRFATEKINS